MKYPPIVKFITIDILGGLNIFHWSSSFASRSSAVVAVGRRREESFHDVVEGAVKNHVLQLGNLALGVDTLQLVPVHVEICHDAGQVLQGLVPVLILSPTKTTRVTKISCVFFDNNKLTTKKSDLGACSFCYRMDSWLLRMSRYSSDSQGVSPFSCMVISCTASTSCIFLVSDSWWSNLSRIFKQQNRCDKKIKFLKCKIGRTRARNVGTDASCVVRNSSSGTLR